MVYKKHLFLTILKAKKLKIKVGAELVFGESLLPGSLCPHMAEGVKEVSWVSFIMALSRS